MSIQNLFHFDYWFSEPFTARGLTLWLLIGIFLLFVLKGLILKILSQHSEDKSKKIFLKRAGTFGITMGFLGLIWMFFRQEEVAFLAWRFWLLLWLVVSAVWAYRLLFYVFKRMPQIKSEEAKRAELEKYLPKKG